MKAGWQNESSCWRCNGRRDDLVGIRQSLRARPEEALQRFEEIRGSFCAHEEVAIEVHPLRVVLLDSLTHAPQLDGYLPVCGLNTWLTRPAPVITS